MNTNLTQVASPISSAGSQRRRTARSPRDRDRARAWGPLAVGVVTALSALTPATIARAATPPGESVDRADPLDLFLDRARGDRTSEEPRAGSFVVGASASLGLSSWSAPSFGVLGFVVVPFDRIHTPRRGELTDARITGGPARLPPADAGVPLLPDRAAQRAPAPALAPRSKGAASAPPVASSKSAAAIDPALGEDDDGAIDPALASGAAIDPVPPPAPLLTPDLARGAARAACKAARIDEADARLDALASRAKTSALLPELRLRATRAIDESESLAPTEYDPARRTASGSSTTWLEARATFRLDRLVFADDEITIERQRMARAAERTRLVERVLDLLDTWQRAHAVAKDPLAEPEAQQRAVLAIASSEASLDVLTDGWFSTAIAAPKSEDRDSAVAPATPLTPEPPPPRPADRDAASAPAPADLAPSSSAIETARAPSPKVAPSQSAASAKVASSQSASFAPARVTSTAALRDAPHPSDARPRVAATRSEKASK